MRLVRWGCSGHSACPLFGGQPREGTSGAIGAGRSWRRSVDRSIAIASILPSVRSVSGLHGEGTAHVHAGAMRSVRRRRSGRRAAPLLGGDASAEVEGKTARGSLKGLPVALSGELVDAAGDPFKRHWRMLAWAERTYSDPAPRKQNSRPSAISSAFSRRHLSYPSPYGIGS